MVARAEPRIVYFSAGFTSISRGEERRQGEEGGAHPALATWRTPAVGTERKTVGIL